MQVIASFLVALLAGLGVGGGGLLVIYLTLVQGLPQVEAQGINLLFFLSAAGAAFLVNRKRRTFRWKTVLLLAVSGVICSVPGALLASAVEHGVLRKCFGGLLILSGIVSLFHRRGKTPS